MPAKSTEPKATKAPAARKPSLRRKRAAVITQDDIAVRAYHLYLEGGSDPHDNWVRAERELAASA